MKKTIFALSILILINISIKAQDAGFGAGIIVGEPTGFAFKDWISPVSAIDAGLGWSFVDNGSTHIHVDYLYHNFNIIKTTESKVPIYFGVGGRLKFRNEDRVADNRFGVRVPVGIAYLFRTVPVDVFLEIVPVMDLSPETKLSFNSAFGVRYYFK
jgi:hypothetical protein